jgi:hypothetical protein
MGELFMTDLRQIVGMNEQRQVETIEEFKLRIAGIVGGKPEHIGDAPRPNPLLVRPDKRSTNRKAKRRKTR